jgi:hypothetical protein
MEVDARPFLYTHACTRVHVCHLHTLIHMNVNSHTHIQTHTHTHTHTLHSNLFLVHRNGEVGSSFFHEHHVVTVGSCSVCVCVCVVGMRVCESHGSSTVIYTHYTTPQTCISHHYTSPLHHPSHTLHDTAYLSVPVRRRQSDRRHQGFRCCVC